MGEGSFFFSFSRGVKFLLVFWGLHIDLKVVFSPNLSAPIAFDLDEPAHLNYILVEYRTFQEKKQTHTHTQPNPTSQTKVQRTLNTKEMGEC